MHIACGVTLTKSSGFIASPNYPEKYLPELRCEYRIRLDKGKQIKITFMKIDIESSSKCSYDALLVSSIPSPSHISYYRHQLLFIRMGMVSLKLHNRPHFPILNFFFV